MITRMQHYVWRGYLRAWSSKERLFCLRNGKIFGSNLTNIGVERDFYKLKELNKLDIELLIKIAIEKSPTYLQEFHLNTLKNFTSVYNVKNELEKAGKKSPSIDKEIDELIYNFEEQFHGSIESSSKKFINWILNENVDFYKDRENRVSFLCFLAFQYFRTKNIKSRFLSNVAYLEIPTEYSISSEKIYNIISHVLAYNLADNLAKDSKFKILLVLNNSHLPFITGDQPVINTFANGISSIELVDDLELYYPVSPHIAILITQKQKYIGVDKLYLDESGTIKKYNSLILEASHEQVYSNSKEILESYLSFLS